jgi:aldose 1-epimerase
VATLSDSVSGRQLEVYTTEPGLQFYTGNFLDGKFTNRDGNPLNIHTALCMETQHFRIPKPNKFSLNNITTRANLSYSYLNIN